MQSYIISIIFNSRLKLSEDCKPPGRVPNGWRTFLSQSVWMVWCGVEPKMCYTVTRTKGRMRLELRWQLEWYIIEQY